MRYVWIFHFYLLFSILTQSRVDVKSHYIEHIPRSLRGCYPAVSSNIPRSFFLLLFLGTFHVFNSLKHCFINTIYSHVLTHHLCLCFFGYLLVFCFCPLRINIYVFHLKMAAKRLLGESCSDPDEPNEKRKRHRPSFASYVLEFFAINALFFLYSSWFPCSNPLSFRFHMD